MKFSKGTKVIPLIKTSGHRTLDSSASYYQMLELNQNFLYINGIDETATVEKGETCYWCGVFNGGIGDSFRESDLKSYEE